MSTLFPPVPGRPEPLSPHEQEILTGIEQDLRDSDPDLMDRTAPAWVQVRIALPPVRRGVVCGAALATVAALALLLPAHWWGTLVALTVFLVSLRLLYRSIGDSETGPADRD